MKNTRLAWFLGIYTALMLCSPSFATDFALNPARDFGAIRRISPTDYNGLAVVRENGAGLSSGTAAAFRAALEVFSKAEAEPAGAVATHAGITAAHGATGAVVGTTNTQALTNKTLTDASNHISGSVIDSGTVADANIASTIARDSELASAMSAANASDALNLRLDGSRAMTGDLKFSANRSILRATEDGADNGSLFLCGGGAPSLSRASAIYLYGNEYATLGGVLELCAGTVSTGVIKFYAGGGEAGRWSYGKNLLIGTTTDDGTNKLQVNGGANITGAATVGGDLTVTGASTNFRNAVKAVDGSGSGLEADTVPNATPATAGASGTAGSIRYDANYIYICVAANTWKRVAIATW